MAFVNSRYIDPYHGSRQKVAVRIDEIHQNDYLRHCTILEHNYLTGEIISYEDEVRDARRRFLDDQHYNMQARMMGSTAQMQMRYYSTTPGTMIINGSNITTSPTTDTAIKVADNKAKKHASNLMKCYWAHYNKIKETTV